MGLVKVCLIMIALCLYSILIINLIKTRRLFSNSIGKKVEDIIPQLDEFMKKDRLYLVLASVISFIVIIFL